jgi:hypothetical protein
MEGKYKFKFTNLEEILLSNETFKENSELRIFL